MPVDQRARVGNAGGVAGSFSGVCGDSTQCEADQCGGKERWPSMMVRISKCILLMGVAMYLSIVAFDNMTDYDSNYQYVRHVLMMDTTLAGNHEMWRAIGRPAIHTAFYVSIIGWETLTAVLCWWGLARLVGQLREAREDFQRAKPMAVAALTLGCMLWFVAFITVGGEWFLMWQSTLWDGREAAFRMFVVFGLVLMYLCSSDLE
jgi:predicted small integral membrane protein